MLLDMQLDGLGKSVKTQAVSMQIDDFQKASFKLLELHEVDTTFKYGFLHALPHPFAGFGDTAQTASPLGGVGGYIVADDDEHAQRARNGR